MGSDGNAVQNRHCAGRLGRPWGLFRELAVSQLPDFYKLPEKVLSKDEQQTKVNDMVEKSQTHQAEAAKKIEGK